MKPLRLAILTTDNREHYRDYAATNPRFGTAPEALLQGMANLPGLEVHIVSCTRQPVQSPPKIADNIFYHSCVVSKISWLRTLYAGCILATRKKLHTIQPDIVHGQGTERDCAIAAVSSGFPNVLTLHGNMRLVAKVNRARPFSFFWIAGWLERLTLPRTDGVVCITNYTRAAVEKIAPRTWVLPNAVDKSFFDIDADPDPGETPVGICVGTICPRKNQNDFIRALDTLATRKKFRMIFLGEAADDDYGREFLRLVRERAWCEHAGFAGREKLKKYFAAASLLALPTREDNCPMVVLEAMAAGVPVIASNIGGVPDLIAHEKTGLLCDPTRPETFRTGVENLLADGERRRALAEAARADALTRFHPLAIARRHVEIYREVLGGR